MTCELVQTHEGLLSIAAQWTRFVLEHPASTPFHLPEWIFTWWEHFGSGSLQVLVFRHEERMVALLPCFILEWQGRKQLTLVGSGITDYLDPLIEEGNQEEFVASVQDYLAQMPDWEVADWTDLSPNHPVFSIPDAVKREGIPTAEIVFTDDFERFWSERGKDLRRNLRRYRERAEQIAPLRFEIAQSAPAELIDTLLHLHTKRWQSQGEPGMVEANNSAVFLKAVAQRMSDAGLARFFVLRFGDQITALILAFAYKEKIYAYMSAFDPDQSALGHGRTLLYEALRASFSTYRAWNFLRGNEPYKLHWGAQLRPRARFRLERKDET